MSESRTRLSCPVCGSPAPARTGAWTDCLTCGMRWRVELRMAAPEEGWDAEYWSQDTVRNFCLSRESAFRDIVALVAARRPPPGSWLDVGCGVGVLLTVAAARGFEVTGIEASRIAARVARERLPRALIEVGVVPAALKPLGRFDVVSLTDVLRHVENPAAAIEALASHLQQDGLLLVREVDSGKLPHESSRPGDRIVDYAQEFAPGTLRRLLRRAGLPRVEILPSPMFLETGIHERAGRGLPAFGKRAAWWAALAANRLTLGRAVMTRNFLALARR